MNGYNPYYHGLGDDGDVSLVGPVILLLGLLGIGAALLFFKEKNRGDYYDDEEPAVERVKNVIEEIENEFEEEEEEE